MEQVFFNPMQHFAAGRHMGEQQVGQNLLRQYGAAAMQGDQNALNALAANPYTMDVAQGHIDRQQRQQNLDRDFGMQQQRLAISQEQLAITRERARMETEQLAAVGRLAEAEREAEQAKTFFGNLGAAKAAGNQQAYQAIAANGPEEFRGIGWDDYEGAAAVAGAALDGYFEALQPQKPADEYGRYVQEETAAGREPLSRIDYKRAGQKSTRVSFDGQGNPVIEEGFGDAMPDLTVDGAKNTGFLIRTQESNKILNQLEEEGLSLFQQGAGSIPGGLGNYVRTPEYQQFDQARRDFVNAILRRESGAVISDEEFANANQQYFPVPGDSAGVIAQKRRNRETAIEGIRVGSGEGAAYVEQQGQRQPGEGSAAIELTGEDRALFEKYAAPTAQPRP